jgi:hypothetical protein
MRITTDLIEGMLCCDLGQINSIPNQKPERYVFGLDSNANTDITVEICEWPFLGLIVIIGVRVVGGCAIM